MIVIKDQDTCVLCFVKYPEKGQVKLRLAADLDKDIVVELYRNFVLDTLSTLKKLDVQLRICFSPLNAQKKFREWLGSSYSYVPQEGNDLGERMKNGFCYPFTEGFRRVILVGSDSPDLPGDFLRNAIVELQTHDIVLGPSSDGGYYLIGFRDDTFLPSMFDGISWSSSTVFQETIAKVKNAGRSLSLLPAWSDVDSISDLKNLVRRNRNTPFKSSHTISYLRRNKIMVEEDDGEKPEL
ncbi:MAG: TIGR04282 family arsenosugar biosynthesis glycosyltransferase [Thermoplasmata archaeon]|nr:TIGR04282 family arsenosugar biosynthesis glycosyltransferase [Thermoplasmata archaeon]